MYVAARDRTRGLLFPEADTLLTDLKIATQQLGKWYLTVYAACICVLQGYSFNCTSLLWNKSSSLLTIKNYTHQFLKDVARQTSEKGPL